MKKLMVALGLAVTTLVGAASTAHATDDNKCPGLSFKVDGLSGPTYTVPVWDDYEIFGISIKAGPDEFYMDVSEGQTIDVKALTGHDVSHVHLCKTQQPTTTTTEPVDTTTTTIEETTTSTSTTSTSSTTSPETTTTVSIPPGVEITTTTGVGPTSTFVLEPPNQNPPRPKPETTTTSTPDSAATTTDAPVTTTSSPTSTENPSTSAPTEETVQDTQTTIVAWSGQLPDTGGDVSTLVGTALIGGLLLFLGGMAFVIRRWTK